MLRKARYKTLLLALLIWAAPNLLAQPGKDNSVLVIGDFNPNLINAQKVFFTKSGAIDFFSKTALENVEAKNNQTVSFLKTEKGDLSFGVLMKSFKFKNALMEEHFNENYIESDKYPKAKFKGKITNLSEINFDKNGSYKANIEGELTLHSVTNKVNTTANLIIDGDEVNATSTFMAKPADYDIIIPAIVREKIAKEITVNVNIDYKLYKK